MEHIVVNDMEDVEADQAIMAVSDEVLERLRQDYPCPTLESIGGKRRSSAGDHSPMRGYGRKRMRKLSSSDEDSCHELMNDPIADEIVRNMPSDADILNQHTPSTSKTVRSGPAGDPPNTSKAPCIDPTGEQCDRSAFDGVVRSRLLHSSKNHDLLLFLHDVELKLEETLTLDILSSPIKWYLCLKALFSRRGHNEEREIATSFFRSCNVVSLNCDSLREQINCAFAKIISSFDEFIDRGSGWVLEEVNYLELNTSKYIPLSGSSYIPVPPEIAKKKAVLNIKNTDTKCFLWAILASLHPCNDSKSANRVSKYREFEHELNLKGITFPMKLNQISKFEKLNNLSINVFGNEESNIFPLHLSTNRSGVHHINLLLISKDETQHFCLIKSMSRLLSSLVAHRSSTFYCDFCLHRFYSRNALDDHITYCKEHKMQKITMPSDEDRILKFKSVHMMHKIPYVIYADFECILEQNTSNLGSHTEVNSRHVPCGYSYVIIDIEGKCVKPPNTMFNKICVTENSTP
nr:uncharacterized protein LOC107451117 [Parasteatoda tepidariorum]